MQELIIEWRDQLPTLAEISNQVTMKKEDKVKEGLKKIINLKKEDIPKEKRWLFKELERPLKSLSRSLLRGLDKRKNPKKSK